ncbi:DUF4234 domain-containing protein [Oryzihumus leptocrescens]|uniref:Uncharacterized protein DUF4234 n=1 Tax=Oryzihumus leptocrescens TaxID=297536 RepID=A0A542ZEP0_9MICO|nr:DUF4234 domain-containing protein [Oryzihumus leptocrescens]TQL58816.1 uncharacterized protein DUF4234 [Oryzihumus leptocrescens]
MTEQAYPEPTTDDARGHELALHEPAPAQMVPLAETSGQLLPQQPGALAEGTMMKRRNVFAVWLGLPLITLGIYNLVWWYKVNAEMAAFDRRHPVNPAATLLAFLFGWILVIPPYLAVYGTGQRIAERQRAAGLAPTCSPALGIVLVFVLGLHTLYYQSELNKIVDRYGAPAGAQVSLAA